MKVLVTGATGGLGRELCEMLLAKGHHVTALGRNLQVGMQLTAAGAQFYACDLNQSELLQSLVHGHEAVVHCAALSSPWGQWDDFERANVQGTNNVIRAAVANRASRFVHISTPSLYFSGKPFENMREDEQLPKPQTHYARSKWMAEELVRKAFREEGLPAVILRPRAIIGRYDNVIVPRILRVMRRGWFPLPGGGKALIDVTAAENVNRAIELCFTAPDHVFGRSYNVTNGCPQTVRNLVEKLMEVMETRCKLVSVPCAALNLVSRASEFIATNVTKKEPQFTYYSLSMLSVTQTLSIDAAQHDLGYTPTPSIDGALKSYASWRRNLNGN